jgi:hypothetical protein
LFTGAGGSGHGGAAMKRALFWMVLPAVVGMPVHAAEVDLSRLYGKVRIVEHFADYKVKIVDHFADLHVQWVDHFPDSAGKWKRVDNFPDFTIQIVDHFPDFTIKLVDHFPGVP